MDRLITESRNITDDNGDTGIVDTCRRSLPVNVSDALVDQAVVFDYELHVQLGSSQQMAIDYISAQAHRGLVADQLTCNWPGSEGSSNESDNIVSDAPFFLQALSSLPVDLIHAESADPSCEDTDEYDCYMVDAAVTARIFALVSGRKLKTQSNITDMALAETMDESLRRVFADPGLSLGLASIVGITYKGITNGPEGFTPRSSDPTTGEAQARDPIRTAALIGATIGGILGFCLLRWLAGCLCMRCMGGGNQSDAKSDANDHVVFSTDDEESDERNKGQDERGQLQNRSLLDDADDDEIDFNAPTIYSAEQPLHAWNEGEVNDDDRYFRPAIFHRKPTGTDVMDDLMRVEERRYRHPDTMDL